MHLGQDRIQRTPNFVGDHGDEFRLDLVQALQGGDVVQYGDGAHVPAGPVDIGNAAGIQDRTRLTRLGLAADLFGQFHEIVSGYGQGAVDHLFNLAIVDDFTDVAPYGLDFPASRHSQEGRVGEHDALLAIRGHDAVRETIDEHAHPRLLVGNVLHGPGVFDGLLGKDSQLLG